MTRRLILLLGCALATAACGIKGALENPVGPAPRPILERLAPSAAPDAPSTPERSAPDVNTPAEPNP